MDELTIGLSRQEIRWLLRAVERCIAQAKFHGGVSAKEDRFVKWCYKIKRRVERELAPAPERGEEEK